MNVDPSAPAQSEPSLAQSNNATRPPREVAFGGAPAVPQSAAPTSGQVVKETLTSILISFVMVFVFRGFVMEPFLIPTGSMAPTLLGAHMQFTSPSNGYTWTVGPWDVSDDGLTPLSFQGGDASGSGVDQNDPGIVVHDPMSGETAGGRGVPIRWGDRIFVAKFPYHLVDPTRWDVIVFRNPREPSVNYIKRLIGIPGEMVAVVDGDIFVRPTSAASPGESEAGASTADLTGDESVVNPWTLPGWRIARKSPHAQRSLWQPLFSSEYAPSPEGPGAPMSVPFVSPWIATNVGEDGKAWALDGVGTYTYTGKVAATLAWNGKSRPITDSYAYNETPRRSSLEFPVSDLRVCVGLPKQNSGLGRIAMILECRGHTFRLELDYAAGTATVSMAPGSGKQLAFSTLASSIGPLDLTSDACWLEFIHADQSLSIVCNGKTLVESEYNWGPRERIDNALYDGLETASKGTEYLTYDANYKRPAVSIEVIPAGNSQPLRLSRVGLWRDVHYQADLYRYHSDEGRVHSQARAPALATHPLSTLTLGPDEFFACGDNSPQSLDGRLWDRPHSWAAEFSPKAGVVHRDLLIGRAFFVYLPSPVRIGKLLLPDFGRVRWIW